MLKGLEDKELSQCPRERELRQRRYDGRVVSDEIDCTCELRLAGIGGMKNGDVWEREGGNEGSDDGAEEVDPQHHLLTAHSIPGEYLVLGGVRGTIQGKVDQQIYHADETVPPVRGAT